MGIEAVVEEKKKGSRFWKYVKRILLTFLLLFLLLVGSAFIIVYFYQDSIKQFFIEEINKQLTAEIQVQKVELSLFQKFPNVSLTFTGVTAKDAIVSSNKGDLLKADNVYLQFSIWDLYDKNYRIKKIELQNAFVKLIVYKDGTDNYHFWKPDTTSINQSFSFDLQKLVFDNVHLRYKNFQANQDYSCIAKEAVIKGKFSNDAYTMYVNGNLFVNYINISGVNYLPARSVSVDMVLNVDQLKDSYTFQEGNLFFGNLRFDITGNVVYGEVQKSIALQIKGSDLKLQSFLEEVPSSFKKYIEDYKGKGEFYFTADINGPISGELLPLIKINFGINNGRLSYKKSDISLENVSFTGEFTNGKERTIRTSVLSIKNFNSKLKSGIFKGDFSIRNFVQPEVSLSMDVSMDMKDLQEFVNVEKIVSVTGKMDMKVDFKGKVDASGRFTVNDFIDSRTTGALKISGVNLTVKNDSKAYSNINGDFQFNNNDLVIDKLSGKILKSDFSLKGNFKNLLSYLFLEKQKLMVNADLTSVTIDLDEMLQSNTTSSDTSYKLAFPADIDFVLNIDIGKLSFNKFSATAVSGKVLMKDKQLLVKPISFNAMDGSVQGLVMVDGSQSGKLLISCDSKVKGVNIKKLFYEFGNFGQTSLMDENLKGKLSAEVQFASVWTSDLEPLMDKIYAKADVKIEDGELLNYAPMKGLSKFIKVSDLNDVKFATLHNQIEIKNKTIYIPAMEIKSSAITINASGEHTFDNAINYRIKLLLSELLAQKARKAKKENEDFGVIEDDGLGKTSLYVLVTGTVDNPIYKYDAKGVKAKIAVGFIKEKQNLKSILNEEFGWFKKDSVLKTDQKKTEKIKVKPEDKEKKNIKKQEEGKFIIDWSEDE